MVGQVLLGQADRLDRDDPLARGHFDHTVNQREFHRLS